MMKTYQMTKEGKYGVAKKVAPMTTETVKNQINCFQAEGTEDEKVEAQSILPDISNFKVQLLLLSHLTSIHFAMQLVGSEVVNGITCEKWQYVTAYGEKSNRYTMWIQRQVLNLTSISTRTNLIFPPRWQSTANQKLRCLFATK